jgi:hypothetical protein
MHLTGQSGLSGAPDARHPHRGDNTNRGVLMTQYHSGGYDASLISHAGNVLDCRLVMGSEGADCATTPVAHSPWTATESTARVNPDFFIIASCPRFPDPRRSRPQSPASSRSGSQDHVWMPVKSGRGRGEPISTVFPCPSRSQRDTAAGSARPAFRTS